MITRAKYEKAVDEAFGTHVSAAFNVLIQGISGASAETKDVVLKTYSKNVGLAIEAHAIAMTSAPEATTKK